MIVRMDKKGRIQLPSEIRKELKFNAKQPLVLELRDDFIFIGKSDLNPQNDPLLYDILVNPAKSKIKISTKILNKMKEEMWSP